jgi:cytochrome P450
MPSFRNDFAHAKSKVASDSCLRSPKHFILGSCLCPYLHIRLRMKVGSESTSTETRISSNMMSISNSLLVAIPILLYSLYLYTSYLLKVSRRWEKAREYGCKPAPSYPHTDPIFGLDLLRKTVKAVKEDAFLPSFTNRFKEVAGGVNTYSAISLGTRNLFTIEPENLKTVLSVNFNDYELSPARKKSLIKWFGTSIFSSDGADWEHSRAMLRPNFTRSLTGDLPVLEKHVANLIARIPRDGQTVDLQELFPLLTMDSASELLFGESTHSLLWNVDERSKRFADAFNYTQEHLIKEMRKLNWSPFPDARMKRAVEDINSFIDQYVAKALDYSKEHSGDTKSKVDGGRYIFLHELARSQYDPQKIRVELLSILTAGRDTTASLLSLLWYNLARRPDIVQKLREEIDCLGSTPPSLAQLKDLKYLRWTMSESMTPVPLWSLVCTDDPSSTASLSYRSDQQSICSRRYRSSTGRRLKRQVSSFCASRHWCRLPGICHASA